MKAALRSALIARRDALPEAERSRIAASLAESLTRLPQFAAASSVLATMSIGSEWNTRAFIDRALADGKAMVLPRISPPPRRLVLHVVRDLGRDLKPGIWEIPEPDPGRCPEIELCALDFALVPALAADAAGYRLGYGGGYFDRLLAGRGGKPFCVTALPAAFVVESLPHEGYDIAVDLVVDERGPIRRGNP